jgi:hypothetical protein
VQKYFAGITYKEGVPLFILIDSLSFLINFCFTKMDNAYGIHPSRMDGSICISGLDKHRVAVALWRATYGGALTELFSSLVKDEQIIAECRLRGWKLNYVLRRAMMCDLNESFIHPILYDANNGINRFEQVIAQLRREQQHECVVQGS